MTDNWFKASTADVFVAMLLGWKEFGHADISWWLVWSPWLIMIGISMALLLVAGVVAIVARILE